MTHAAVRHEPGVPADACAQRLHALPQPSAAGADAGTSARVGAALARVGHELMCSLAKAELFERLCRIAAEVLHCDAASTLLREKGRRSFLPVARYGEARRFAYLADPAHPIAASARERLAFESVVEVKAPGVEDGASAPSPSLWLCIALRRGDRLAGILVVGRVTGKPPFSHDDHVIAEGIARLASLGLENARLLTELERANHVKSDFVATMSHELRTPLHIILGYLSLIVDGDFGELSAAQREALQHVERSARTLLDIVQDTLDLSRLESGGLPVERRRVPVGDLFAQLDREIQRMPRGEGVAISWRVDAGVPALFTDPGKLKIVLSGLISNALKFTARGSVTIAARSCGEGVELSVGDTGQGIPRGDFGRIFEPFTQLGDTSTRTHGGVGLGLYVARRLAELLGGTVSVSSRIGVGSTFRVWIPAQITTQGSAASSTARP